jgi:hypothetical protein
MSYSIVIIDEAKIDFKESFFWYKNISPKLAQRYHQSFKQSLRIIKKHPFHSQIRYDEVRIIMLNTFPCLIHYTVEKNVIVIKAIYHSSRDSKLNIL